MNWELMTVTSRAALIAVVASMWLAVLVRLVADPASTAGLLSARSGEPFAFYRLQMLVATLIVAIAYAVAGLADQGAASLPNVPAVVLLALAGSQATYLGNKFAQVRARLEGA